VKSQNKYKKTENYFMAKEIGKIKEYGGFDHHKQMIRAYGFISRQGKADIFFHRSQVQFDKKLLAPGLFVEFEAAINPRQKDGKEEARCLQILDVNTETDIEVIKLCFLHLDKGLFSTAAPKLYRCLFDDELLDLPECVNDLRQLISKFSVD
jgi:cold shock CspA family protein